MQEMKCLTLQLSWGGPPDPLLHRARACWQSVTYYSTLKVATQTAACYTTPQPQTL